MRRTCEQRLEMTLEHACALIADCPHTTAQDEGAGYPLVRTPNIGYGRLVFDKMHRVSRAVYDIRNKRAKPLPGDLIYAREAPAGNVALIMPGQEVCLGQRTVLIRPNPEIVDSAFLTYYLLAPAQRNKLLGTATGATVAHVNVPAIRNLEISLPPLPTQKRIADILSAYDDLIENNRRRMEILEESARLIFKERFEDVWERGKLPRGWRVCCVPDCIEVEPEVANPHCDEIRYIPMAALSTAGMTIDITKAERRAKATSVRFVNGDVLLAGITPCLENGKTGFVNFLEENEVACGSTEFIVLRGRTVSPYFTYCLSRTDRFRETAIKSMVGASGRQRVQPECFDTYEIALPTTPILRDFDEFVEPMFEQIGLLLKQNQDLAEARDMLLPKLINGRGEYGC